MRVRLAVLVPLAVAVLVAGCGGDDPSVTAAQAGKPVVITGLRPLAEAVEEVAGDSVVVVNLTPIGESPHELELTPRQEGEVRDADLAIVVGRGFQAELERVAARRAGPTLDVLAALDLPDRPGGEDGPLDPHVWLDPTIMGTIVTTVAEAVAEIVPDDASGILARAEAVVEEHVRLDAQLQQGLQGCRLEVVVAQHDAFSWLAGRYGLRALGLQGPMPEAGDLEPDPDRLAAVEDLIEDGSVTTLFAGTLVPGVAVEALADAEDLDVAVLNAYEGLTPAEAAEGATYRSVLLYDLQVLQDHLDCEGSAP